MSNAAFAILCGVVSFVLGWLLCAALTVGRMSDLEGELARARREKGKSPWQG